MQVLTIHEEQRLLRLLFSSDAKTFAAICSDFTASFAKQEDRLRACCAALLLLEDSRALSTAQRLGTWYTLYAGWGTQDSSGAPNPFLEYLEEVPGDARRSAVERHLVLQLLKRYQISQLDGRSPLDYAMSYSLPLVAAEGHAEVLKDMGAATGSPVTMHSKLDAVLQSKKARILQQAAAVAPPAARHVAHDPHVTNGLAASTASSASIQDSLPTTPARGTDPTGAAIKPPAIAVLQTPPGPVSHPLPLSNGQGGDGDWAADGDASGGGARSSSSGGSASTAVPAAGGAPGPVVELVERALQGPLLPAQQTQVLDAMAADPTLVHKLGVGPPQLPALVEHAPNLAVDLLTRLAPTPAFPDYLATLAQSNMSLHSMEVVNQLTTTMALPTEFLHLYIAHCIHSCEATTDKYVQSRLVRLLCVFLHSLIRNRIINIIDLLHEVQAFCVNFSRIREAAKLFRLLKQIESGGRLGVNDALGSPTAGTGGALDAADQSD